MNAIHTPPAPDNERFLKPECVMNMLCYSDRSAFWSFIHASGFPFVRLNSRRILFERAAVDSWLARRSVGKAAA